MSVEHGSVAVLERGAQLAPHVGAIGVGKDMEVILAGDTGFTTTMVEHGYDQQEVPNSEAPPVANDGPRRNYNHAQALTYYMLTRVDSSGNYLLGDTWGPDATTQAQKILTDL
jgi:hypothetical protein